MWIDLCWIFNFTVYIYSSIKTKYFSNIFSYLGQENASLATKCSFSATHTEQLQNRVSSFRIYILTFSSNPKLVSYSLNPLCVLFYIFVKFYFVFACFLFFCFLFVCYCFVFQFWLLSFFLVLIIIIIIIIRTFSFFIVL